MHNAERFSEVATSRTFRRFFGEGLPAAPPSGMADIRTWTVTARLVGERIGALAYEEVNVGGESQVGDCVPLWLVELSLFMANAGYWTEAIESAAREIAEDDFRNPNADAWLAAVALVELQNA